MDCRRLILTILYIGIIGWLSVYVVAHYVFLGILLLIVRPFLITIPLVFFIISIILFFIYRKKKWFSAERLLPLLLLLPILLTTVIPYINKQVNLYKKPTDSSIRSYFQSFEISQPKVLNLSDPLITYNDQNKTLLLNVKLDPELYKYVLDSWKERNIDTYDDSFANYIINNLSLHFIWRAKELNEITLRPNHIIVHGYWGNESIVEVHYTKVDDEYIVSEPYPDLKLIVENGQIFLSARRDESFKKLQIYEINDTNFYKELDLYGRY